MLSGGQLQDHLRRLDVRFNRVDGSFDHHPNTNCGGKVEDDVGAIDELHHDLTVHDGVEHIRTVRVAFQVGDVVDATGGEIIDDLHSPPAFEKRFRKMRADKTRSSGDQCSSHVSPYGLRHDLRSTSLPADTRRSALSPTTPRKSPA